MSQANPKKPIPTIGFFILCGYITPLHLNLKVFSCKIFEGKRNNPKGNAGNVFIFKGMRQSDKISLSH